MKLIFLIAFFFMSCSSFSSKHFDDVGDGRYQHRETGVVLYESYGRYEIVSANKSDNDESFSVTYKTQNQFLANHITLSIHDKSKENLLEFFKNENLIETKVYRSVNGLDFNEYVLKIFIDKEKYDSKMDYYLKSLFTLTTEKSFIIIYRSNIAFINYEFNENPRGYGPDLRGLSYEEREFEGYLYSEKTINEYLKDQRTKIKSFLREFTLL